ncbi:MAG: DNA replication/repair protein RecF [Brumimicrobium sp.]|nr:DNA replication/repair protein RecF [Brumimicrobium sp.]
MDKHQYLSKLSLVNFKNYKQLDIILSPDINCFIGANGVGKTNILDALYYLSMCRSYLNPIDSQNIQFDEGFFMIQGSWQNEERTDTIYCGVKRGQKKVFSKNKVAYEKLSDHIGSYPCVMISPYDRDLITEGSEERRKWLDSIISQFDRDFLNDLIKYNKVLEQRNALLKNMFNRGFFELEDISVWDEQLVTIGCRIYQKRAQMIVDFIPIFQKYYQWLSNDRELVDLNYRSQLSEGDFSDLLAQAQFLDRQRGNTSVGPHKDDFIFTINGQNIKKFGSQGQQKSYLISLRLAQYEWLLENLKKKPVLLLDDIFDKLDNSRVERLMQMVHNQRFGQVLITDTDKDRIASIFEKNGIPYKAFYVNQNTIVEENEIAV